MLRFVVTQNIQYYHAVALEVNHKEEDQDLGCPKCDAERKGGCSVATSDHI